MLCEWLPYMIGTYSMKPCALIPSFMVSESPAKLEQRLKSIESSSLSSVDRMYGMSIYKNHVGIKINLAI